MANDIGKELYEKIEKEFHLKLKRDTWVRSFLKNVKEEKATLEDCFKYSETLGGYASEALTKYLTEDNLPNGKFYWNICKSTIEPIMREVYEELMDKCKTVNKYINKANGIGLNPVIPEFPVERIENLMNKLVRVTENV